MDWAAQVDGYCERVDFSYWAEPVNAVTNAAFVLVALFLMRRTSGLGLVLCGVLAVIGLGSFLFHTHATRWAGVVDVVPILAFILIYIFAANRDFWGMGRWQAIAATGLFFPYAALMVPVFGLIPGLGASAGYAPVALLIALYGVALFRRETVLGRGLLLGAGLLSLSIAARALDLPLCQAFPVGTHFVWHILNALMLGWMIHVWSCHTLAGRAPAR